MWANKNYKIKVSSVDSLSGIKYFEYVDSITEIISDPDDYCENVAELVDGFQKFKDAETNKKCAMKIVFDMLKYEADLVWCECIDVERSDLDDYFEMHEANFDNMLSSLILDLHQPIAIC